MIEEHSPRVMPRRAGSVLLFEGPRGLAAPAGAGLVAFGE